MLPTLEPCTYCGLPATTRDHLLPRVLAGSLRLSGVEQAPSRETVPACHECNAILGSRIYDSVAQRRAVVHASLARRYRSALEAPQWSDEQLDALGPTLRTAVLHQQQLREITLTRLCWPQKRVPSPTCPSENRNGFGSPLEGLERISRVSTHPGICDYCGATFRAARPWSRFCSPGCRTRAWNDAHPRRPLDR